MAYLALVTSHTVNGVAAIHSNIIKDGIFKVSRADQCAAAMSVQPNASAACQGSFFSLLCVFPKQVLLSGLT